MNELSYRLIATALLFHMSYFLLQHLFCRNQLYFNWKQIGYIICIRVYYLDTSILSLRQLQVANIPEYNRWRYWYSPSTCAHLGTDIPFLHRRPLSRRYKFAFDCIATCARTRMCTFGVCIRSSMCARITVCICLICGASNIMSICRYGGDSLRSFHWRASGTFMPDIG